LKTLTELSEFVDVLNRHSFASLVGHIGVVTFRDFERGEESYGFVAGVPVPYARLCAILTGVLFRFPTTIGLSLQSSIGEGLKADPILRIWDKVSLPSDIDTTLRSVSGYMGVRVQEIIEALVTKSLLTFCSEARTDEARSETVALFMDRLESALFESRQEPIPTMGLKRLHDYPYQGYDWDKIKISMKVNYDMVI
jgi:hypothetical protein